MNKISEAFRLGFQKEAQNFEDVPVADKEAFNQMIKSIDESKRKQHLKKLMNPNNLRTMKHDGEFGHAFRTTDPQLFKMHQALRGDKMPAQLVGEEGDVKYFSGFDSVNMDEWGDMNING